MSGREQRLVFGEDAELYDRARPTYTDALIDAVAAMAGPEPAGRRAVEVGAGTGKATVPMAARGLDITAVEADPGMAAVLSRHVSGLPRVRVAVSGFEDWDAGAGGFDLLYSAQAWHWIRPEVRYVKAASVLRQGGGLALFWHRVRWPAGDPLRAELEQLYLRLVPELHAQGPGFPGLAPAQRGGGDLVGQAQADGLFTDAVVSEFAWLSSSSTAEYLELLRTQSDHRLLDDGTLRALSDEVAALVERHGGSVDVPYATVLLTARRV